jgi:hypothetical protein
MLAFRSSRWIVCENLTWRLVVKKLHIVACELHYIYNIVYNIWCSLQLENPVVNLVAKLYIFS